MYCGRDSEIEREQCARAAAFALYGRAECGTHVKNTFQSHIIKTNSAESLSDEITFDYVLLTTIFLATLRSSERGTNAATAPSLKVSINADSDYVTGLEHVPAGRRPVGGGRAIYV